MRPGDDVVVKDPPASARKLANNSRGSCCGFRRRSRTSAVRGRCRRRGRTPGPGGGLSGDVETGCACRAGSEGAGVRSPWRRTLLIRKAAARPVQLAGPFRPRPKVSFGPGRATGSGRRPSAPPAENCTPGSGGRERYETASRRPSFISSTCRSTPGAGPSSRQAPPWRSTRRPAVSLQRETGMRKSR